MLLILTRTVIIFRKHVNGLTTSDFDGFRPPKQLLRLMTPHSAAQEQLSSRVD